MLTKALNPADPEQDAASEIKKTRALTINFPTAENDCLHETADLSLETFKTCMVRYLF
jgi:hypothetical protein